MKSTKLGLFLTAAVTITLLGTGCGGRRVAPNPAPTVTPTPTPTATATPLPTSPPIIILPPSSGGFPPACPAVGSSGGSSGGCGGPIAYPISSGGIPISSGGIPSNGVYIAPPSSGANPPSQGSQGSTGQYSDGSSGSASIDGDTKDVDLQRAAIQQQQIEDQAQGLASQFSMNIDAARNLTLIANKMSALTSQQGGMTDDDRAALTDAALNVAGISNDQVTAAYANYMKGDTTAVETLLTQAATNLGMPSSDGLKDQILPSLGINIGQ